MSNDELLEIALDENLNLKAKVAWLEQAIEEHRRKGYYGRRAVDTALWATTLEGFVLRGCNERSQILEAEESNN